MNKLVQFWKKYRTPAKGFPRLHPCDREHMGNRWKEKWGRIGGMRDYLQNGLSKKRFHFSLEPIPFVGDLKKADVVILMLNPGFVLSEYHAHADRGYRDAIRRTLEQNFDQCEFPFFWLDPNFSWCDGFVYWEKRLRKILEKLVEDRVHQNYWRALREASKRIALIELVPYCSVEFPDKSRRLPSAEIARAAAKAAAERAQRGECVVIVGRGAGEWKLPRGKGVLTPDKRSRGFYLPLKSERGKAIKERLANALPRA